MTKFAPHKALKSIARGKLPFDGRVVLDRAGEEVILYGEVTREFNQNFLAIKFTT